MKFGENLHFVYNFKRIYTDKNKKWYLKNWKNLQKFQNFVDYWNCEVMNKLEYECLRNCAPKMIGFLNNSGLCKLTE